MNINRTCCFTGIELGFKEDHPDCVKLKKILLRETEALIYCKNISRFITGTELGVHQWYAETVLELKKKYRYITLELAVPYDNQAINWKEDQRKRYDHIASKCDKVTILHHGFTESCMMERNKYMVENSGFVIALWSGRRMSETVGFARELNRRITVVNPLNFSIQEM